MPLAGIVAAFVSIYLLQRSIITKTQQNIRDLVFPSSNYEAIIYFLAMVVGYFHIHLFLVSQLIGQILLVSFLISLLIGLSSNVRSLVRELTLSLSKRDS